MEENTYSVFKIADWFLGKADMTPKKLQKLVYYAYSWTLVMFNEKKDNLSVKLFEEELEAWVHGPVVRELYFEYNKYGYREISKTLLEQPKFEEDIESVLEQVWSMYGAFNANQLESLTHNELPWQEARKGLGPLDSTDKKISDQTIYEYYGTLLTSNG